MFRAMSMCMALVLVLLLSARLQTREARVLLATMFGAEMEESADPPPQPGERAELNALEVAAPNVNAELLAPVSDNTYFRDDEAIAWFHLFQVVRDTEPGVVTSRSVGPVVYAQLARQPTVYRGRVVTVLGEAARIESVTPAANDLGIDKLYRVTVRPAGGDLLPILVYTLELPDGFGGETIPSHSAKFVGYFFKNLSYKNSAGVNISPVIVAKSFAAEIEPTTEIAEEPSLAAWQIALLALVVAGVAVVWIVSRPLGAPRAVRDQAVDFSDVDYRDPPEDDHVS
jgi:hypothetical protein